MNKYLEKIAGMPITMATTKQIANGMSKKLTKLIDSGSSDSKLKYAISKMNNPKGLPDVRRVLESKRMLTQRAMKKTPLAANKYRDRIENLK